MAILNFPPATGSEAGKTYEANGVLYTWDGYKWEANSESGFDSLYVEVAGDNMTGDLTLGGDKITLDAADGSAEFAEKITVGVDGVEPFVSIQKNVITNVTTALVSQPVTNEGALQVGHVWGSANQPCAEFGYGSYTEGSITTTSVINRDGSHYIGGTIPASPNITLDAAGNGNFKQRVAGGLASVASEGGASRVVGVAGYNRFDTVNPSGEVNNSAAIFAQSNFPGGRCWAGVDGSSGSILPTSEIFANGSATFGAVDPNASDKVGVSWGVGGASITLKTQGTSAINGTLTNGYELFRGNIKVYSINYAGTSTFSNAILNLEADDDTKYTATTDADGEETLVYNGAVLDVKERLQKTDAALTALKSAAAAASDFAALKSAIATALADI